MPLLVVLPLLLPPQLALLPRSPKFRIKLDCSCLKYTFLVLLSCIHELLLILVSEEAARIMLGDRSDICNSDRLAIT
jgi:hypothetical protein